MDFTPRPYQTQALDFLKVTPRANLYAGMGLGKTATILALVKALDLWNVLIIAPKRVTELVWPDEALKWDQFKDLNVEPITGEDSIVRTRHMLAAPRVACINYDNIIWLAALLERRWPFTTVIADESTRLKGLRTEQGAKRASALSTVAFNGVERWINLTATPTANGLLDLWGPQWFVDGGASLGLSYYAYEQRWFYRQAKDKSPYARLKPFNHSQKEIEERIKPTTLSIRTEDWFDIAKPIEHRIYVDLPAETRAEYRRMQRELIAYIESEPITAANAAVKSGKLLQLANGAIYKNDARYIEAHDEKLEALKSIVTETMKANLLVVYHYRSDLARIKNKFKYAVEIRDKDAVARWNKGEIQMLLVHPRSAGHGLNLQHGGHHIVYFGVDWNLEEHVQVLERIGPVRQMQSGFKRSVFVYYILARNSIDDVVMERQESKRDLMESLLTALRAT
jgi:SNF2 family DNA or RNA helicase